MTQTITHRRSAAMAAATLPTTLEERTAAMNLVAIRATLFALLLDTRVQTGLALALALLASLLLGPDGAEAGVNQGCQADHQRPMLARSTEPG